MPNDADDRADQAPWTFDLTGSAPPVLIQVRRCTIHTLGDLAEDHVSDVLLVATELVSNDYDHGHGPRQLRMSHTPVPCRVRIEIDDNSPDHPVVPRHQPVISVRGRGMLLVERLAECWGVEDQAETGGKTVWAVISCAVGDRPVGHTQEAQRDGAAPH
jgi:anti-sigma regulatory factor (Ser/Thr protein kinase)